jgi:hypothetical protein
VPDRRPTKCYFVIHNPPSPRPNLIFSCCESSSRQQAGGGGCGRRGEELTGGKESAENDTMLFFTLSGRIFGRITQKGSNKKKRGLTNKAKLWLILYSNGQKGMKFKKVSFPSLLLTNYRQVQDLLYFSFGHIVFFSKCKMSLYSKGKITWG